MKDFLGNELKIGDTVAVPPKHYRGIVKAKIKSFTPKNVRVIYNNTWNYGPKGCEEEYLLPPQWCVKVFDIGDI